MNRLLDWLREVGRWIRPFRNASKAAGYNAGLRPFGAESSKPGGVQGSGAIKH
jgi:hypothetical protein